MRGGRRGWEDTAGMREEVDWSRMKGNVSKEGWKGIRFYGEVDSDESGQGESSPPSTPSEKKEKNV